MRKKKGIPFSEKAYKENLKQFRNDKDFDYIMATRADIDAHYNNGAHSREELINRIAAIDFSKEWDFQFAFAFLTGIVTGFIVAMAIRLEELYSHMGIEPAGDNLAADLGIAVLSIIIAVVF